MNRTADGTTIVTSSSSDRISAYVLPEDLLEERDGPLHLKPQGVLDLPEPTNVVAPAPYFALGHPGAQVALVACKDHPIQLYSLLPDPDEEAPAPSSPGSPSSYLYTPPRRRPPLANYNLIKPQTEEHLTPTALLWLPSAPGTHFVTGTQNLLATFDVTRVGEGPLLRIPTIPSARHVAKGGGVGMRGTVSALSAQPAGAGSGAGSGATGLVAAGTWTRWVGLYDLARGGACASTWSVAAAAASTATAEATNAAPDDDIPGGGGGKGVGGQGILQTLWSPCGRYLLVNERQSAGLLVYDVRVTGRLLGWLAGRPAETHQRLSCDVFQPASSSFPSDDEGKGGFEVWAGTQSGTVAVWQGVGSQEGRVAPGWGWGAHGAPVGSTAMHASGSVVATCSGAWTLPDDEEDDDDGDSSDSEDNGGGFGTLAGRRPRTRITDDASLKIWSIGSSGS